MLVTKETLIIKYTHHNSGTNWSHCELSANPDNFPRKAQYNKARDGTVESVPVSAVATDSMAMIASSRIWQYQE